MITARKMICRMSPSTKALAMVVGMMWVRKSHQCWFSPFSIRPPTESGDLDLAGVGVDPSPSRKRLIASSPMARASSVPTWK